MSKLKKYADFFQFLDVLLRDLSDLFFLVGLDSPDEFVVEHVFLGVFPEILGLPFGRVIRVDVFPFDLVVLGQGDDHGLHQQIQSGCI